MRIFLPFVVIPVLAACSTVQTAETTGVSAVASATLVRGDGSAAGIATLSQRTDGLWLSVVADAPGQGTFGMHIHAVGKCDGPEFTTAGPHWNPAMKQHGRNNPMGAHGGDLPNVVAGSDKKLTMEYKLPDIMLEGPGGLLDADGAALVIHEKADDYLTDPSGNSGKRIVCGAFKAGNET